MSSVHEPLRAEDFLLLIAKLSREKQVRLAVLALRVAATDDAAALVAADRLPSDYDSLGWDAEGWDELLPPR